MGVTIEPGSYTLEVEATLIIKVEDLTQDEIDKYGVDVFRWAIEHDYDYEKIKFDRIVDVTKEKSNDN